MGIKDSASYRDYWSSRPELRYDFSSSLMGVNRFSFLLANIRINDNSLMRHKNEQGYDKLYKLRPLIDRLNENYKKFYAPTKEQAVDESMVKYKGRVSFKQYMPQKPIKRAYKIWVRDFQIYTGRQESKT